jgi:hypothetical protein
MVESKVYWLSPKLMSLLDNLTHKASYWSVYNYEKRVNPSVRYAFLILVEQTHCANRQELAGILFHHSTIRDVTKTRYAMTSRHVRVAQKFGPVDAQASVSGQKGGMDDTIAKITSMGTGKAKSLAPAAAAPTTVPDLLCQSPGRRVRPKTAGGLFRMLLGHSFFACCGCGCGCSRCCC